MLQQLESNGVLQPKQHEHAAQSVKASMATDTTIPHRLSRADPDSEIPPFIKPAMAHRLAGPGAVGEGANLLQCPSTLPDVSMVKALSSARCL